MISKSQLLKVGWLLLILLGMPARPHTQAQSQPNPFGIVESYEAPLAATELGASWTRVTFNWGEIKADGADSWTPTIFNDAQLVAEADAGREIVGLIIGIPSWARDENDLPQGLWLAPDDPANLWANFVREIVSQYAGSINHWVIWNEPDIWDKNTPGHTWDGDERDFAQLLKTAYLVAKESNPNSVLHLPAMTYYWDANFGRDQYLGKLLDVLVADPTATQHNYYFDVATAHLYFQPGSVYEITNIFVDLLRQRGLNHPIWLVETNAPPADDPSWRVESITLSVTLQEQAAYQPQAIASALSAGAERVAIYKLRDIETDYGANPEPFGLVRMDGSYRPAFTYRPSCVQFDG